MTSDGKDIDARRGRYRLKKGRYRPKKEGILYEKLERISCDAQSGDDSDQLESKVDDLKSKPNCKWNDEEQNIRFQWLHCSWGTQE